MSRKFCVLAACSLALLCTPAVSSANGRGLPVTSVARAHHAVRATSVPSPSHALRHLYEAASLSRARRARIVGGYGAVQSDWPFMAFVAYFDPSGNPEFVCSGTVVSVNVILTAGHCAVDETTGVPLDPSGFRVVTGNVDWADTTQRQDITVSQVIVNPAYDSTTDADDAALLVLSTPTTAPAIPLATSAEAYVEQPGTDAFIAGWGATYGGGPFQTYLQWAPTVVQSSGYCSQFYPYFDSASELCAVNPPDFLTGTCNGDSGGPLAAYGPNGQLVEIGVTDLGPVDCNTSTADYFAAIVPLNAWVATWINAVAPAPPPPAPSPAPSPAPAQTSPTSSPPASQPTQPAPPSPPMLTLSNAKQYARQTVVGALGPRAKPTNAYSAKCSRDSSTRFTCAVQFWHGPNDYYGNVTVDVFEASNGSIEWTDKYTLHWVNDRCYFHSGHPQTCATHTRRGTW